MPSAPLAGPQNACRLPYVSPGWHDQSAACPIAYCLHYSTSIQSLHTMDDGPLDILSLWMDHDCTCSCQSSSHTTPCHHTPSHSSRQGISSKHSQAHGTSESTHMPCL